MARISLGICLMLIVASSVIYEAQGHFLLKHYLRKSFPTKCNEFTPYANKGIIMLVTDLESGCPATPEFKTFFTNFKSYMTFIESSSTTSKNVDVEMTTKAEGLFKSMSVLGGAQGQKSADAGLKVTLINMGKTLVEQKKNAAVMTMAQKKRLVVGMVKWTKTIATFVKTASEKKGKTINIASFGLDVDVNDKSLVSTTSSSTKSESSSSMKHEASSKSEASSSTKHEASTKTKEAAASGTANASTKSKEAGSGAAEASTKSKEAASGTANASSKTKEAASGTENASSKTKEAASGTANASSKTKEASGAENASSKTKEASGSTKTESAKESSRAKSEAKESSKAKSGAAFSDTTGAKSSSPSGSPTASPSGSTSSSGKTSAKGAGDSKASSASASSSSQAKESQQSGSQSSSSATSVKQVETETSKDAMSFIMELEKKYSGKTELKAFFEKLKASMAAFAGVSSKTSKDYVSATKAASSKLSEAMALVGSRNVKSAKMKSNMEDCEQQLMKTLQELIDINSKIVNTKSVTSTQQSEIKQTITKWEKVTTQFVETASSSSSSSASSASSSSKSEQSGATHVKKD